MDETTTRLLLVDDEISIREPLSEYLTAQGFDVHAVVNAAEARQALGADSFDLIICDVMMPGEDGLSLTRHIRETVGTPVILLTARSEETERIIGLEIGADDYVPKPFSPRELVARIRAVLRRAGSNAVADEGETASEPNENYYFGDWRLSLTARDLVHQDGRIVDLSSGEFQLLLALVRHTRQVMTRERLLDLVRGRDADIFDRSIDNLVSRLRRKIDDDARRPHIIKTVWGGGYVFGLDVRREKVSG